MTTVPNESAVKLSRAERRRLQLGRPEHEGTYYTRQLLAGRSVKGNYSDTPRGRPRTRQPRDSIWPADRFVAPCRRLS